MKKYILDWQPWLYGLVSGIITGVSTTLLSVLGVSAADAVGFKTSQFDIHQITVLVIVSGIIGAASYLKQSPLPKEEVIEDK